MSEEGKSLSIIESTTKSFNLISFVVVEKGSFLLKVARFFFLHKRAVAVGPKKETMSVLRNRIRFRYHPISTLAK